MTSDVGPDRGQGRVFILTHTDLDCVFAATLLLKNVVGAGEVSGRVGASSPNTRLVCCDS